jgi:hypothetical protein
MKKIGCIFICMLVCLSSIVIMSIELKVEATTGGGSGSNGLVGLDYQEIYKKTKSLTDIVFNITDNGIYKGRAFGTEGEHAAADIIYNWMINYTDNLTQITDVTITQDSISNKMNRKIEVLGYALKLSDGMNTIDIPNNESFPIVCRLFNKDTKNFSYTDVKVKRFPKKLLKSESTFDVSYIRLNTSNPGLKGQEVVYIENYTNVSENETFNMIHLINVSDNKYNDTVDSIANLNGTGFILMRDNVSNIACWNTTIPGIAISIENASIIKNLVTNESQYVEAETPYYSEDLIPETGTLTITNMSINFSQELGGGKKLYLVKEGFYNRRGRRWMRRLPNCVGMLISDRDPANVHTMYQPHRMDQMIAIIFGKLNVPGFYSSVLKPSIFLNCTIRDNNGNLLEDDEGKSLNIFDWVTNYDVKADFWVNEEKNPNVQSYNVLCKVKGKNSDKKVIIGAHYDGFWGQCARDNAVGVGIMLGLLKYFNDHSIIPKYDTIFIAFGGEEYTLKGSRSYVIDEYSNKKADDIKVMISLCNLAKDCTNTNLYIQSAYKRHPIKRLENKKIVGGIAERTNYDDIFRKDVTKGYELKVEQAYRTVYSLKNVFGNDCYSFYHKIAP